MGLQLRKVVGRGAQAEEQMQTSGEEITFRLGPPVPIV